ncbi:MAG TPA: caspase family protein, partial [Terriglobales bacterium]|nr:caspase family protein [Terriglobales bacterium]
ACPGRNRSLLRLILICIGLQLIPRLGFAEGEERCGIAKDYMVQALEQIKTGSREEAEDGLQLLKHANEQCTILGDAWYYRSLFERKLNHLPQAEYALNKARFLGSDAMTESSDPFTLAAPTIPGEKISSTVHDKWALVIGINKFQDAHVPRLKYTSKDARDFAALLQDPAVGRFAADHVHLLADDQATTRKIKEELNWLARSAAKDDLVVVFLSSHGSPREKDTAGVNYVITSDTDLKDADSLFATALPMVELVDVVRTRIQARRAAIFLDTCHSGAVTAATANGFNTSQVASPTMDRLTRGVGRVIIASSEAKEKSYESDKVQNGYFTHSLVRALKQDGGAASVDKVFNIVRDEVSKRVLADWKVHQTPVISKSSQSADIVIGVRPETFAARAAN